MGLMDKVIVALDFPNAQEADAFLDPLLLQISWVKVGMQLFYAEGPSFIRTLQKRGLKIFLDLKLHDIPNTVAQTAKVLASLQIQMLTLHTLGGSEMIQQTATLLKRECSNPPLLLGVTQLTSTSQTMFSEEMQIQGSLEKNVLHLGQMAYQSGCGGLITSGHELPNLRKVLPKDCMLVTPGIRQNKANSHDQKRVVTPMEALKAGADFLVMGREITQAENPSAFIQQLSQDHQDFNLERDTKNE